MAGTVMPSPVFTGLDNSGNPLSGGKLHTYETGGSTPQATYSDSALSSANANPVVLNAGGRATVYLLNNVSYKFLLTDASDVTVWSQDNIQSVQNIPVFVNNEYVPLYGTDEVGDNATSYPSGATGGVIVPGSRIVSLVDTNMTGTWKLRGMLRGDGTTPSITVAFINLTDANTTPLTGATINSSSTVGASVTSGAISGFASGAKDYGCKIITSDAAKYGFAYGLELVRTA
mgnify:CR=1 FL=1|jgi:hypothetical protein